MKFLVKVVVILVLPFTALAGGGGLVGNGGDTVRCQHQPGAIFVGTYSLDYLLDYRSAGPLSNLAPVESWIQSRDRLLLNLTRLSPVLAENFKAFAFHIFETDRSQAHFWTAADLSTADTHDQEITKRLPGNCYVVKNQKLVPDLRQTVVRRYLDRSIEYLYETSILDQLKRDQPLQFSFFIVHEWLWDLTQDVKESRRLNWILHSRMSDTMKPEDLQKFFEASGFFSRSLPVCDRSRDVRSKIEQALGKACDAIAESELSTIQNLDLSRLQTPARFRPGDFSKLFGLVKLDLSGNSNLLEALPPYIFADLVNLKTLDVTGTGIKKLPPSFLYGITGAKIITDE